MYDFCSLCSHKNFKILISRIKIHKCLAYKIWISLKNALQSVTFYHVKTFGIFFFSNQVTKRVLSENQFRTVIITCQCSNDVISLQFHIDENF